ncbi:MAG: glycine cleavage system protein GcvH [Deltaproteobacteria bacterium]|nr:glycine cleavage system protein GcvH [Deltaproteobacteria bacterium]
MSLDEPKFSKDHLWAKPQGETARVGITDYAQEQLGEIVYVDLPDVDDEVEKSEALGEVESTKTVSELIAPVSGKVLEVNDELEDNPGLLNEDPYGDGWLIEVELADPSELDTLMDAEEYEKYIEEER